MISRLCFGCPGCPPGLFSLAGLGGDRFTDGPSLDGGFEELRELIFRRASRSVTFASSTAIFADCSAIVADCSAIVADCSAIVADCSAIVADCRAMTAAC